MQLFSADEIQYEEIMDSAYEKSFKYVRGFVFSYCMDTSFTDKIMVNVVTRATKEVEKYDKRTSVFVWLCNIAKEEMVKAREDFVSPEDNEFFFYNINFPSVPKEKEKQLITSIKRIEKTQKEIFFMHTLGKLPFSIIAEIYGRPEVWVKNSYLITKAKIIGGVNGG